MKLAYKTLLDRLQAGGYLRHRQQSYGPGRQRRRSYTYELVLPGGWIYSVPERTIDEMQRLGLLVLDMTLAASALRPAPQYDQRTQSPALLYEEVPSHVD